MKKLVAMVLAGGAFSALGILAERRAKAAIPFGGMYRIIDFVLSNLMNSGVDHVGILAQYRPASLIDHVGVGMSWDLFGRTRSVKILPPYKGEDASDWYKGTADAVYQNLNFIHDHQPEEVLVLAGENIYTLNYQDLLRFHREHEADCTIVCNPLPAPNPHRFGIMSLAEDGRIASYHEKPKTITGDYYSAGIYVFNTDFLLRKLAQDASCQNSKHNFADDILPDMVRAGEKFYGYVFHGYWAYCGTVQEYWRANMDLLHDSPDLDLWHWNIRTNLDDRNIGGHQPALVLPTATVRQSLISSGCKISGTVENSLLSAGVIVEEGAVVRDSILFHETRIKKGATVDYVISDKDVVIGEASQIGLGDKAVANEKFPKDFNSGITVVGKEAKIGAQVRIGRNTLIYPGISVPDKIDIASGRVIR
ncbi:glucose-1-phosphate adenylyltransferase [candidate division KSB3 bacterium]|uniref:Glucose-1-phosphate adenylyltransferase n=1 Tax=candidate division KSB3 bacterium TaxID=2044937 RepID=A0A9D5Q6D8_9BACT|nr:glucose-1-phosphate adenylyltransferase [candidate division KSB3 bacterium]MBD3325739.1 glucose-1-phosphate adenylyltransferase [candidate division KSB3 bacterium]